MAYLACLGIKLPSVTLLLAGTFDYFLTTVGSPLLPRYAQSFGKRFTLNLLKKIAGVSCFVSTCALIIWVIGDGSAHGFLVLFGAKRVP